MIIKAFSTRAQPLKELAALVGEAGRQGIVVAGGMLEPKTPKE
jgi:hypothetical protein